MPCCQWHCMQSSTAALLGRQAKLVTWKLPQSRRHHRIVREMKKEQSLMRYQLDCRARTDSSPMQPDAAEFQSQRAKSSAAPAAGPVRTTTLPQWLPQLQPQPPSSNSWTPDSAPRPPSARPRGRCLWQVEGVHRPALHPGLGVDGHVEQRGAPAGKRLPAAGGRRGSWDLCWE